MESNAGAFISGGLTGLLFAGVFQPIDALRMRLFFGLGIDFRTLYRGFYFNVTTATLKGLLMFPVQSGVKNIFQDSGTNGYVSDMIGGFVSAGATGAVSNPINRVKVRLQDTKTSSSLSVIHDIYHEQRFRGFYKGSGATFGRDTVWNISYFPLFSFFQTIFESKVLASFTASFVSMTLAYPLDGMRLRIQMHGVSCWSGLWDSVRFTKQNLRSYCVSAVRLPLASTVSQMIYLTVQNTLSS